MKELFYTLNPNYQIKNDIHRATIYYKNVDDSILSSEGWTSFIHPTHAMILSFFTKGLSLDNSITEINKKLKIEKDLIRSFLTSIIENKATLNIEWKNNKILLPKNILVPRNTLVSFSEKRNYKYIDFKITKDIDLTSRRLYSGPQLMTIMLTNWCYTNCKYCYADITTNVRDSLVKTDRILEVIEEAKSIGVRQINLIGGEIFLHPNWDIILKKLVDYDLSPEYISTKIPFTEKLIKKIQNTGYKNPIQFSLDSLSPVLLSNLLSVDSKYVDKVKIGLNLLDKSGLKYRISSVLTTTTTDVHNFTEMCDFISSLKNLTYWSVTPASQSLWRNQESFSKLKPKRSNSIELLNQVIQLGKKDIPIKVNKAPFYKELYSCKTGSINFKGYFCSALNFHLFILPDGQVTICEQLYWNKNFIIGSIKESSIIEIWNSPKSLKLAFLKREDIQHSSPCKQCDIFESCFKARNRCWADIIRAYGWDNFDYPDPRCFHAPKEIYDFDYKE